MWGLPSTGYAEGLGDGNLCFGLLSLMYRIVKRMARFENLPGDAEVATMVGGTLAPAYRTRRQAVPIMHAIPAPIQAAEGRVLKDVSFFALASDSSTDRGAHKAELIYTRTMRDGQSGTAFLGLQELQAGTAVTTLGAYKQVIPRAGLSVEQSVGRVFWYCADGASVMQSDGQQEVLGDSLLVLVHANCHRADLAFRDAMDRSHEFLDHVADTMNAFVVWYRNAPHAASQYAPPFAGFANLAFAIQLAEPAALGGICALGIQQISERGVEDADELSQGTTMHACIRIHSTNPPQPLHVSCIDSNLSCEQTFAANKWPQKEPRKSRRKKRHKVLACMHACMPMHPSFVPRTNMLR